MLADDDARSARQERQRIMKRSDNEQRASARIARGPDRWRLVTRTARADVAEVIRARIVDIGRDAGTRR
jgi:hypothetical protein